MGDEDAAEAFKNLGGRLPTYSHLKRWWSPSVRDCQRLDHLQRLLEGDFSLLSGCMDHGGAEIFVP